MEMTIPRVSTQNSHFSNRCCNIEARMTFTQRAFTDTLPLNGMRRAENLHALFV